MPFRLEELGVDHPALTNDPAALRRRVERLLHHEQPRLRRLMAYYENPIRPAVYDDDRNGSDRPYRQAQEWGLPSRLTGTHAGSETFDAQPAEVARKEIVVENDIRWRVDTQTDFLFGRPLVIDSTAEDAGRRRVLQSLVRLVISQTGGMAFLQRLATMGAVHGAVDVIVSCDPTLLDKPIEHPTHAEAVCDLPQLGQSINDGASTEEDADPIDLARLTRIARCLSLEIVPPTEAMPLVDQRDPGCLCTFGQVWRRPLPGEEDLPDREPHGSWLRRLLATLGLPAKPAVDAERTPRMVRLLGPRRWQLYENERLVGHGENPLGRVPVVRILNAERGASDVEPLMPLQDELNTRLCDRANRLTLQSFKMYLGKGITDFTELPIRPGQMWQSDNPDADVIEFGTDAPAPSEVAHIEQLRAALDKASGVSPVAAGVIQGRVGQLTSAQALRVTMVSMLARTDRKRLTYGSGIARIAEMMLAWLDATGLLPNAAEERGVKLHWPSPLPADEQQQLLDAKRKLDLGINADVVRRELGY